MTGTTCFHGGGISLALSCLAAPPSLAVGPTNACGWCDRETGRNGVRCVLRCVCKTDSASACAASIAQAGFKEQQSVDTTQESTFPFPPCDACCYASLSRTRKVCAIELLLALGFVVCVVEWHSKCGTDPPSSNLPNGTQRLYIVPPSNAAPQDMGWWQDLFRRSSSSRRAILVQEQPSPPSQPQQSLPSLQLEEGGGSLPPLPPHITSSTPPMANSSSSNGKKENGKEPHNHRAKVAGKGDIYD